MRRLELIDNTDHREGLNLKGCEDELLYLSSQTITKLKDSTGKNLLIFPHSFQECDDKVGKQGVFTLDYSIKNGNILIENIKTGNLMGFIGINDVEISISSRFTSKGEDDYFLQYMLQKVMYINVFNLKYGVNREIDAFDLLAFMFPEFLKRAMRKGVFRRYMRHSYNDANVKGPINVMRHLQKNIPFNYRIAYTTREFDADNSIMQLIRHTIEYIRGKKYGSHIIHNDRDTDEAVRKIIHLTPTYNNRYREQIIKENCRPINHPYYTEYASLQKLCLQILKHNKIRYGESKDKIYGVLFDGAWLWEEYLNTLLKPIGYSHPENKTGKGKIYLCKENQFQRFPDFYKEESEGIILDAKYKRNIDTRDDVNQMLTYMYRLKGRTCAFILPQEENNQNDRMKDDSKELLGYGGTLSVLRMDIPQQANLTYSDYKQKMNEYERFFIKKIESL